MTYQGVLIDDDPMEHALRVARGDATAIKEASTEGDHAPRQVATPAPRTDEGRWLDLERERRTLEARLKVVVSDQERLRLMILERWSMDGTSKASVDGQTIHMRRKVYPKVTNAPEFVKAAIKEGREFLLTVDAKTLAVWVTTKEEEGEPLPPSLAAHLGDSFERFDIAVRLRGRDQ